MQSKWLAVYYIEKLMHYFLFNWPGHFFQSISSYTENFCGVLELTFYGQNALPVTQLALSEYQRINSDIQTGAENLPEEIRNSLRQPQGVSLNVADDSCRVVLKDSSSDYINASHVEYIVRSAEDIARCRYIATQVQLSSSCIFHLPQQQQQSIPLLAIFIKIFKYLMLLYWCQRIDKRLGNPPTR